MQLVLDTRGLSLNAEKGLFVVSAGETVRKVSPEKITSIAITHQCNIGSEAVLLAVEREIPIFFTDRLGRVQGRLWSPYFTSLSTLRRKQVMFAETPHACRWVVEVLELKLDNADKTLNLLKRRRQALKETIDDARWSMQEHGRNLRLLTDQPIREIRGKLMAAEGAAIRPYWKVIGKALPELYQFDKRSRMPAQDPFNAALNYLYGMLYGVVESAIFAAGLDPHLGLLHVDQHDKPTLAFDLIEAFRPWADALLIEYALDGELRAGFFNQNKDGILLSREGKSVLIPAFNDYLQERIRWLDRESSRRNHIYHLAGLLAQHIRTYDEPPEE